MAWLVATNEGTDRGYAAFAGVLEIYVAPVALVAVLVAWALPRFRRFAPGLLASTLIGTVIVVITTLIVGNGDTWR